MSAGSKVATLADPVTPLDNIAGPEHARVTVVEYGDFECPTCAAIEPAVRHLRDLHGQSMRFVFRHFPLEDAHPHALMAAEAAEAAGAQSKFWEMHDLLLQNSRMLGRKHLEEYALRLELDIDRFRAEMAEELYRQRVREHQEGGRRSYIHGTPAFFVDGVIQDVSGGVGPLFDAVAKRL
jgi:protein-disulfide isomerase